MIAKILRGIIMFLFPASTSRALFSLFRVKKVKIGKGCKIGFSIILVDELNMANNSTVGQLNVVIIKSLQM